MDWLTVKSQSREVGERHVFAPSVDEDGAWLQDSGGGLGSDELGIHEDQLLDHSIASGRHRASQGQHVTEAVLLAGDLEVEPIVSRVEGLEFGDELVLPLEGGLRQPDGQNNLVREVLVLQVLLGAPGDEVGLLTCVEHQWAVVIGPLLDLMRDGRLLQDVHLDPVKCSPLRELPTLSLAGDCVHEIDAV